jgi:hypothetical protein
LAAIHSTDNGFIIDRLATPFGIKIEKEKEPQVTSEIRNLKGEIVSDRDPDEKWYHLSASTWLLIGGLILFNIGCFLSPNLIDNIFRALDVRLWPWWYLLFLGILIAFSVKWFFIYRNWEDYDELEAEAAKRFNRMAIAITVVMAILVLLNVTNLFNFFYHPLQLWLGYGDSSWIALLSFVLIFCVIVPLVYFVKEWLVTFVSP